MKMQPNEPDMDADALVALLDQLCASGSEHIHLNIGEETKVQTVSSTECNPQLGPCAVPNLGGAPDEEEDAF